MGAGFDIIKAVVTSVVSTATVILPILLILIGLSVGIKVVIPDPSIVMNLASFAIQIVYDVLKMIVNLMRNLNSSFLPSLGSIWNDSISGVVKLFQVIVQLFCITPTPSDLVNDCPNILFFFDTFGELMKFAMQVVELLFELFESLINAFRGIVCEGSNVKAILLDDGVTYEKVGYFTKPGTILEIKRGDRIIKGEVKVVGFCVYACGLGSNEEECWSFWILLRYLFEAVLMFVMQEVFPMIAGALDTVARWGGYYGWARLSKTTKQIESRHLFSILFSLITDWTLGFKIIIGVIANFGLAFVDKLWCMLFFGFNPCILYPSCQLGFGSFDVSDSTGNITVSLSGFCDFLGNECVCNHCVNPFIPPEPFTPKLFNYDSYPCLLDTRGDCDCNGPIYWITWFTKLDLVNLYGKSGKLASD
jgi:hypothetical protein